MKRSLFAVAVLFACTVPAFAQPPVAFNDAAIHAVQFVDKNEGWAVGDDGVVWHTIDSGTTWERQKTGTRASLRGVHFITPYTGWAVGRVEKPSNGGSIGVMLRTSDGGIHWEEMGTNVLPGLNSVRFFDEATGIVCGDGSDAFPGGVFSTPDGGKTWRPAEAGGRVPSWRAMDFNTARVGIMGGAWSKLAAVRHGPAMWIADAEIDPLAGRTIHGVKMGDQRSYAVGDGGMVLTSTDGKKWGFTFLPLSSAALACCDFRCVSTFGSHVWVAGRPGSFVLHSGDHGKTWDVQKTNVPVPLNGLHFISEHEGIAVGELGTILATKDGGKTWVVRQLGGARAAVMCLHAAGRSTPVDVVSLLGHGEGYLTTAVSLMSADPAADPKRACDDLRLRSAMRLAGGITGETVWGFPVPAHTAGLPPRELMATWDKAHAGKANEQLLRQAVLAIRMWQPEILLADAVSLESPSADVLVLLAAQEAFKQAADATAFPEQITDLGLKPWGVKKLYAPSKSAAEASVRLDLAAFHPALGDSPSDFAEPASRIITDSLTLPTDRGFKLISHRMTDAEKHTTLMQGIELARGGSARRDAVGFKIDAETLAERQKASQSRRHLVGLAGTTDRELVGEKILGTLASALNSMPDDLAARTAHAIATRFVTLGHWAEAREVYVMLIDKYPGHPLAIEAFRWLIRYHASSEARRRVELQQQVIFQHAAFQPNGATAVVPAGMSATRSMVGVLEDRYRMDDPDATQRWHEACLKLEPRLAAFGPAYSRDPAAWLCLLAARRHLGMLGESEKFVMEYFKNNPQAAAAAPGTDVFRDCLAAELWSLNHSAFAAQPKPLTFSRNTETRPFLDGKLNDDCWQGHTPIVLKSMSASGDQKEFAETHKTEAMFCYDDRFLYVAVRCGHPTGHHATPASRRSRDADLTGHDRVDILLDIDRDYQTYYRFQIDHRGCLAEDCWGDRTWNPKYFVGFHPEPNGWTAELAIPLGELTGDRPSHGRSWAMNVSRLVPGRGLQAWNGPADAEPRPEGMGLLQFRAQK